MNIEIKKLSAELIDDYLHFFDTTPHSERPDSDECKCYCVWWCGDDQTDKVYENYLSTKEKRREYARNSIVAGKLQGYLAYCENEVVGWCNANTKSECYQCFCWKKYMGDVHKEVFSKKIKSIFCFAVSPKVRGMGVATKLLEQICKDAKLENFESVEAYPNSDFQNQAEDFMGPLGMYKKLGFVVTYEIDQKKVMVKKL